MTTMDVLGLLLVGILAAPVLTSCAAVLYIAIKEWKD